MYAKILGALLPVAILLYYIYRRDKFQPEPPGQLIKAFGFGLLTIFVSLAFSAIFISLGLRDYDEPATLGQAFMSAFVHAAIPEECAKLLVLWLFLRSNKYFDEHMDGVVYSVCVGLGFAAAENVLYIFGAGSNWISVGIARGLMAVPGHYFDAILMGYFYSLVAIRGEKTVFNRFMILAAPILAHGVYDYLLMLPASDLVKFLIFVLLFALLIWLRNICSKRVQTLLDMDNVQMNLKSKEEGTGSESD